jgi:hypothetical protein
MRRGFWTLIPEIIRRELGAPGKSRPLTLLSFSCFFNVYPGNYLIPFSVLRGVVTDEGLFKVASLISRFFFCFDLLDGSRASSSSGQKTNSSGLNFSGSSKI